MTPFPHFAPLPPASPAEQQAIFLALREAVTPRVIRFDQIESVLAVVADVYYLLLIWALLALRISARLRDFAEQRLPGARRLYWQSAAVYLLITLVLGVAGLPLSIVRGWAIPHAYGLSNQDAWHWLADHWKAIGLNGGTEALVVGLLAVLARRFPTRWPVLLAAVFTPLIGFGIFLQPLLVDPLFNKFTPLPTSSPLYAPLHALTHRAGVGDAAIYVVDKSRQTNETNAYVTGFGPSLRIILWDTLLKRMGRREVIAIAGHELGHYTEGHLALGFAMSVAAIFIAFPLIAWLASVWQARYGPRWGLRPRAIYDPASLPLLLLCLQLAFLVTQPFSNLISRWIEHRADAYSLGIVGDRVGLARGFVDFTQQDLDDPYPPTWEKIWFDDHPPGGERIEYALNGQP